MPKAKVATGEFIRRPEAGQKVTEGRLNNLVKKLAVTVMKRGPRCMKMG